MGYDINKAAVLGSGVMGAALAAHIAGAGIPVYLLDIPPVELTDEEKKKGLTLRSPKVRNRLAEAGKKRLVDPKNRSIYDIDMAELIKTGNLEDDLAVLQDCNWIVEAIVENLEAKQNLMQKVSKYRRPGTIVSTNTSGVSINKIADALPLEFKQHFLGTHFFNPPRYMRLLEIIPSTECLPEVVDFMKEFGMKWLGKGIIIAKDTPAFIANRIGTYAMLLVLELMDKFDLNIIEIDQVTGPVMGRPKSAIFRTCDLVGLDTMYYAAKYLAGILKNKDEIEILNSVEVLKPLIDRGYLGRKTGQGMYKTVDTGEGKEYWRWDFKAGDYVAPDKAVLPAVERAKQEKTLAGKLQALLYGSENESKFAWELTKKSLLFAARMVPEITDDFKEIDKALIWGMNWQLGLFGIWDAIGVEKSVQLMREEGETVPEWVGKRLVAGKKAFYDEIEFTPYINLSSPRYPVLKQNADAALVDLGDGVICLQFKSKNNTITDKIVEMMGTALEELASGYIGMVIGSKGNNFCPGANLNMVGEYIMEQKWDQLDRLLKKGQNIHLSLKYCRKPVVAAPYGMALGGGAEVCLHAHALAAHAETYMGLVEVGVGVVPAGGGCKEVLLRFIGEAEKATGGDLFPFVQKAWETVVTAKVSSSAFDARKLGFIRKTDRIVMNVDYLIDHAKDTVLYMAESGYRPQQKKDIRVMGTTGRAMLSLIAKSMVDAGFASEYDAHIAGLVAKIMTGGDVPNGVSVPEEQILELEREAFLSLCGEEKTLQRMMHLVTTGKILRN